MKHLLLKTIEIRNMPETAAILLAYVRERSQDTYEPDDMGWRCITGKEIEEDLNMGYWKYVKYFQWLVKAKMIETKRVGREGRRWVRLLKESKGAKK